MRTTKIAAAAVAALGLLATPALAKVQDFARSGGWSAFYGTAEDGKRVCGMSIYGTSLGGQVIIKYFEGNSSLTVQIFKGSWRIPNGTRLRVQLSFDSTFFGEATATGYSPRNGAASFIEFGIGDLTGKFMSEFAAANVMYLRFPDGSEAPWTAKMTGSRNISVSFQNCLRAMRQQPTPTQPYASQPPSQPFGRSEPPSQPFGSRPAPAPEPAQPAPAPVPAQPTAPIRHGPESI